MSTLLTGIPSLQDGGTTVSQSCDDLRTTTEEHEYYWLTRGQQLLYILFLLPRQAQTLAVTVLTAEHHVLAHSCNDDVGRTRHAQGLGTVGFLTGIYLTIQHLIVPCPFVAAVAELGFNLLRPVTTARIRQFDVSGAPVPHSFPQTYHMGMVKILVIHFPEIGHRRERVVTAHRPHAVGVGSGHKDALLAAQRKHTTVFQQHHRLRGNVVCRLPLFGTVEHDFFVTI